MRKNDTQQREDRLIVVGGGLAGLTMVAALAHQGFRVALLTPKRPDLATLRAAGFGAARSTALLQASVAFYQALGLWSALNASATPLKRMALIDDRQSKDQPFEIEFTPDEIQGDRRLGAFGHNVPNAFLEAELVALIEGCDHAEIIEGSLVNLDVGSKRAVVTTDTGDKLDAGLVIAADGSNSLVRQLCRIEVEDQAFDQSALTFVIGHEREHDFVSTEFQKPSGPLTIVPQAGKRSAIVWVKSKSQAQTLLNQDKQQVAKALEADMNGILGRISIEAGPGFFPVVSRKAVSMTQPRVALIAETAHAMPPIGAQGLNSSIMDVAWLTDALCSARDKSMDLGALASLRPYEAKRKPDIAKRFAAVNALNKLVLGSFPFADALRRRGLGFTKASLSLRDFFMQNGMMWREDLPKRFQQTNETSERNAA